MPKRAAYGYRKPRKKPGKQWLEVGNGKFALVDEEDWEQVSKYKWRLKENKEVHTLHKSGEPYLNLKYFLLKKEAQKNYVIYHLDGNKLNYSKDNIKWMTLKEFRLLDKDRRKPDKPKVHIKHILKPS